jgi:23S rRNA pseudouridine1911/1915/1917 synthase
VRGTVDAPDAAGATSFIADQGDAGGRLDRALLRHVHDITALSRTRVQQWIADGRVTMNGTPATRAGATVPTGARIVLTPPSTAQRRQAPMPEPGALAIIHEDEHLLVLDKPAGLVVHPSYRNTTGTLLNHVLWHLRDRRPTASPGLVSRLDKGTSGLVVVALNASAFATVQRAAAAGHARKEYLAVVRGPVHPAAGTIALPLGRDGGDRRRMVVSDEGFPSETRYETLATGADAALLRCHLVTGRTHQIRVHLAARGWPLLGDVTYGVPAGTIDRPALHAWRITLPHPATGTALAFEAPPPADLRRLMAATSLTLDRRPALALQNPTV